jgi:hypothetical protein
VQLNLLGLPWKWNAAGASEISVTISNLHGVILKKTAIFDICVVGNCKNVLSQNRGLCNNTGRSQWFRDIYFPSWMFLPLLSEVICLEAVVNKTDCFQLVSCREMWDTRHQARSRSEAWRTWLRSSVKGMFPSRAGFPFGVTAPSGTSHDCFRRSQALTARVTRPVMRSVFFETLLPSSANYDICQILISLSVLAYHITFKQRC